MSLLKEEKYHKWYILPLTGPRDSNIHLIEMENMRYSGIIKNDLTAGEGVCVSFFTQGCHFQCSGCHNPETWDFEGGKEFTNETLDEIVAALQANGIHRDLAIMGGEPLCPENQFLTLLVINYIKEKLPDTKVYLWTGYTLENLDKNNHLNTILDKVDILIDGPYIESQRDITLKMRGSTNQRILYKGKDF